MVDEYQVEYEYSDGNTISFKTNDLKVQYTRPFYKVYTRVDGVKVVSDPGYKKRMFTFTAIISGNDMDTLDSVQTGSITYSGAYPRIKKIYWDGDSTESNIEIAIMSLQVLDSGKGWWQVSCTMEEKDQ